MGVTRQLKALMWKNLIVRYKREPLFIFELGVPLLLGPIYYLILLSILDIVRQTHIFLPTNSSFLSSSNLKGVSINYIPKSVVADKLMDTIKVSGASVEGFSDLRDYLHNSRQSPLVPLIVFRDIDNKTTQVPQRLWFQLLDQNYTLHFESMQQDTRSGELFDSPAIAAAQKLVTEAFINYWNFRKPAGHHDPLELEIGIQKMNHSIQLPSSVALANLFSSIIICSCVPVSVNIIRVIVSERSLDFKEFMQLLNVSEEVYWLSWCLVGMLGYMLIESAFFVVVVVVKYIHPNLHTNLFLIVILFIMYATNSTSFCLLVASFVVNEATRTYVVILVVPFILYVFASASVTWMTQMLSFLLGLSIFQVAFCMSVKSIVDMEYSDTGYTFSNLLEEPLSSQGVSLFSGMTLMLLNTVFNIFWMWYFNKIQPTHYADPNYYLLCFQRRDNHLPTLLQNTQQQAKYVEPDYKEHNPAIQLHSLVKCSQNEVIVAETTMNIYDEQITVILGPNGPDKAALIGMITGLALPTQGSVIVYGCNVVLNRRQAQENIGLCPRHDVLYKKLTCVEHLKFFYNLKGIDADDSEVMELLIGIQLAEKALTKTVKLSAYEKRLLSLATATIGDPKVVILDEPSKGLNLAEQRELWSFLKTLRSNRTILVTTINVNEAETLADRTAVIIDGDVKCYGSQVFLKHTYGVGYQLNIVKQPMCRSDRVSAVILHLIPTAILQEESEMELHYYLPQDAVSKFSKLLFSLENHIGILEIQSLGIYSTTLDEVFAKVQRGFEPMTRSQTDQKDNVDPPSFALKKGQKHHKKPKKHKKDSEKNVRYNKNVNSSVDGNKNVDDNQRDDNRTTDQPVAANTYDDQVKVSETNTNTHITERAQSNTSLDSNLDDKKQDILDTFVNMEFRSTPSMSSSVDEYAFKKNYRLNPFDMSGTDKIMAVCIKSTLIARRKWIVTIFQTGTPSLLLIAGLLLDMQAHYNNQSLSIWYTMEAGPQSNVQIITTKESPDALVNIYVNLLPPLHIPVLIRLNTTLQELGEQSGFRMLLNDSTVHVGVDFSNKLYRQGIALYSIRLNHAMAVSEDQSHLWCEKTAALNLLSNHAYSAAMPVLYPLCYYGSDSLQLLLNSWVHHLLGHDYSVNSGLVTEEYLDELTGKILCPTTTLGLNLGLVIFSMVTISTLITDRRTRKKDLLELYGVTPVLYWLSTFAWDMAVYTVLVACIMIVFCLEKVIFLDDGRWIVILLVLYLSAVAFLWEIYILQKFFNVRTNGILFIVILHVFTGVCGSFVLLFWEYTRSKPEYLKEFISVLSIVLEILSPLYSFTAAILPFPAMVTVLRTHDADMSFKDYFDDIEFNGVVVSLYRPLTVLLCQSVLCCAIVLLTDTINFHEWCAVSYASQTTRMSSARASLDAEDDDITLAKEEVNNTVLQGSIFEAALVLQDLRKCYGKLVAVEGTCLVLQKGDCFGLLGPSGSGKSTTLRMLIGFEPPSSGNAFVKGYSIQEHLPKMRRLVSYTPQYITLYPNLTGRETLLFFGRLRGIPDVYLHKEVDCLIHMMTLDSLANSAVLSYGVSKQRLLSIAMGFLGQPVLVVLDEPSYGLDTSEKKALWTVMKQVRESESAILFTTESVEECETVCTKMAIQVGGKLKCLGSPSHLKTRYAMGYTIILYMQPDKSDALFTERLVNHMQEKFPGVTVSEKNMEQLRLRFPRSGVKLFEIFHTLKAVKRKFHLNNYMVHETTLEQVYLSFTLGHHVKPFKLIPKKKTVTWADGTKDVVNTIPNKYSDYQIKSGQDSKSSIGHEDVTKFLKSRFSYSQPSKY